MLTGYAVVMENPSHKDEYLAALRQHQIELDDRKRKDMAGPTLLVVAALGVAFLIAVLLVAANQQI